MRCYYFLSLSGLFFTQQVEGQVESIALWDIVCAFCKMQSANIFYTIRTLYIPHTTEIERELR